jgi:hypothetical protein
LKINEICNILPFAVSTLTDTDPKPQVRHKMDASLPNADEKRRNDKFLIGVQPFVILILKGLEMSKKVVLERFDVTCCLKNFVIR